MWVGAKRDLDEVFVWRWPSNNNTLCYWRWVDTKPNGDPYNMKLDTPAVHQDCLLMYETGLYDDKECAHDSQKFARLCSTTTRETSVSH